MKKSIPSASYALLALTVPVVGVLGLNLFLANHVGLMLHAAPDAKIAQADHQSGGCCCAYCTSLNR